MPLRCLKSALCGALAAACGVVAWVAGTLAYGLLRLWLQAPAGAGGLGAVSVALPSPGSLLVSLACFVAGSVWMYRRAGRNDRPSTVRRRPSAGA